jgi:DNA-directed RNA polymerase specialized sigma24 family protein
MAPALASSETARLTRRLAAGDEAAFGEFHRGYFNRLYRHILVLARGDETAAKEALQETLCRVARYVRQFEQETVFWCWLTTLARSAVRDGGRRRRRYWLLLQSYAQRWLPLLADANVEEEGRLHEALAVCLLELPPEDRVLV